MDEVKIVAVPDSCDGLRLDQALVRIFATDPEMPPISRSKVADWIAQGRVIQRGVAVVRQSRVVTAGESFEIKVPTITQEITADYKVQFPILYEDEHLLVIDKPAALTVHPGVGGEQGTLAHGLIARYGPEFSAIGHPLRPGIVHRLDKGTSGLMVVARSIEAFTELQQQFMPPRRISRSYLAVVYSLPKTAGELIDLPLARDPNNRIKMSVQQGGREARTRWRLVESLGAGYLLALELETGRTHQIRAHLERVSSFIVGDPLYGMRDVPPKLKPLNKVIHRQALHAYRLSFDHPVSKERMSFSSTPPDDFNALTSCCRELGLKGI